MFTHVVANVLSFIFRNGPPVDTAISVLSRVVDDLCAMQDHHCDKIEDINREMTRLSSEKARLEAEHDKAGAIAQNVSALLLVK